MVRSRLDCGKASDTKQERLNERLAAVNERANVSGLTKFSYSLIRSEKLNRDLYLYKRITSGKVIEEYEYTKPQGSKKGNPEGRKIVIEQNNPDKMIDSLKKSSNKAKAEIRHIINSNVDRWGKETPKFFTITFADNIQDQKAANYEFTKFIQKLNYHVYKEKCARLKYLVVLQYQARGAIHWHVIFFNLPFIPVIAELDTRGMGYNLQDLWAQGSVKINAIDNVDNVGAYVAEYVGNEKDEDHKDKPGRFVDFRYFNEKRYFCSKGLHKPKIELSLRPFKPLNQEPVYENEYENEYTGLVKYRQFNPRRKKSKKSVDKLKYTMIQGRKEDDNKNKSECFDRQEDVETSLSDLEGYGFEEIDVYFNGN